MRGHISVSVTVAALASLVLAGAAPRTLAGQTSRPAPLDSATQAAIAPILAQAQATNLPTRLLYAKAREGQVRRAPVAVIEASVRALAERIHTANEALAPNASDEELRAGVDALGVGVPMETLREMRRARPDGSLAVPIGVLTQLVVRGVPVEQASVKVVYLLQRGANSPHFIALDTRVREDVLAGRRPDESLDLRLKGIQANLPVQAATETRTLGPATTSTPPKRPR